MLVTLTIISFLLKFSCSQTILKHSGELKYGKYYKWDDCPLNSFASGFGIRSDSAERILRDDQGMTGARLFCVNENNDETATLYSRAVDKGGWKEPNMCGESEWLKGFRVRLEGYQGWTKDDTALNNLEMMCTSGETLSGSGTGEGKWTDWSECPEGEVICGLRTRVEDKLITDHLGLVAIQMRCCGLSFSETERSYFPSKDSEDDNDSPRNNRTNNDNPTSNSDDGEEGINIDSGFNRNSTEETNNGDSNDENGAEAEDLSKLESAGSGKENNGQSIVFPTDKKNQGDPTDKKNQGDDRDKEQNENPDRF